MSAQVGYARFGVRTLLMAMTGAAVALNWLRDTWAPLPTGFVLVTYFALVIATLGAIWGIGRWRQCCGGFALCAAAFFVFFEPWNNPVHHYLPRIGCPESFKEMIVNCLPLPNPEERALGAYRGPPPPIGATDPDELFPRREPYYRYQFADLEIDPISIATKVFGLGSPPPDPYPFMCTGCIEETPPPALAIQHCISTFFVGICGAVTVCWLQRPQESG